jgi:hypothetical protein
MNGKHFAFCMSFTYFAIGILPLPVATLLIVLPATLLGIVLSLRFPAYGKLALKGLLIGLIAVFLYDCMRAPFILTGIWGDFIPKINMWLFNTSHPNWVVGYIWRYVGDGGFMGMAFTVTYCMLKPRVDARIAGVAFGLAIWVCLLGTLVLAPHGQQMLFKLTLTTMSLSLLGHLIYGIALGTLLPYVLREKMIGTAPTMAVMDYSQVALEVPAGEEATVILPPCSGSGRSGSTRLHGSLLRFNDLAASQYTMLHFTVVRHVSARR